MDLSQIMLQNWGDQAASSQVNDRATWNNTLQDIFQKRATLDRYQQETPHYINEKALAGNRALRMNTDPMLDAYAQGQQGLFKTQKAAGEFDERTLESRVDMTNQENKTKMVGQAMDNFAQIADLADAAFSKGGDQAVAGLLQQVSPELSSMYQQALQQGKSGKQVIGEFKTRIGQIKDQLQVNRSYSPEYYAKKRLQDDLLASQEKQEGIRAASSAADRKANPNQWKLIEDYTIAVRKLKAQIDQYIASNKNPPRELLEEYGTAKKILKSVTDRTTYTTNPMAGLLPNAPQELKKRTVMGEKGQSSQADPRQFTMQDLRTLYPGRSDEQLKQAFKQKYGVEPK